MSSSSHDEGWPKLTSFQPQGERELAFRRRFLYFCGGLPLFEMIAIVCLLSVADCASSSIFGRSALADPHDSSALPVDVVTVSYWLVCALSLNAFVLLNGWPAMRKRGTRQVSSFVDERRGRS